MVHKHRGILINRNAIFSLCETSYEAQFRPDVTSFFVGWCIYENFRSLPRPWVDMEHVTKRLSQIWRGTGWHTPYSKMAAVSDDLGRVAWKRGIEGQTPVVTNAFRGRDTLSCLRIALFQSVKEGLRLKRSKDFFPHSSWRKKGS